jgi:hypothetical protein
MSVTIAGIEFEHLVYDERADALYLTVAGYEGPLAEAAATAEGHESSTTRRRVIAMTFVNVKWLLDGDGELTISWPARRVKADELCEALASAA